MTTRRVERDEDLALFHEMQRREHERRSTAMRPVSENTTTEAHLAARLSGSSLYRMATAGATANVYRVRTAGEELLASDMGKNDYDWLLTPPGTPLVTGSENDPMADVAFVSAQKGLPNLVRSLAAIKTTRLSREISTRSDPAARTSRSNLQNSSSVPNRRSSLAPTSSTPASRPVSRPSTPTSRPIIPSSTSNSNNRSMSGSSTTRSGIPSRSSTPLRRPSTPISSHANSQPAASAGGRSSSASKISSLPSRSTPASRGNSPTTRPRAWQPSTMPGFSLEPPPNLRTTVPARSISNSRGASISSSSRQTTATVTTTPTGPSRPGRSSSSSSSPSMGLSRPGMLSSPIRPSRPGTSLLSTGSSRTGTSSSSSSLSSIVRSVSAVSTTSPSSITSCRTADTSRRRSCSPSVTRGRTSTAERPLSRNGRVDSSPGDTVGRGTKMVDKMIQSRRSAALSLSPEELPALQLGRAVKPSTPTLKESCAYGKAMSRKSIDIALRHMDIRQSASNGIRPLVSNMPTSSFYTVRSVIGRGVRPGYSPLTTSSTASSDHSMSKLRDLEGSEMGEEVCSEVGSRASPMSAPDSTYYVAKEARVTNWMESPDFSRDESVELMQMLRKGIEKLGESGSPLVCPHQGAAPCDLCNLKSRLQSLKASPMSAESMMLSSYSGSSNGVPSPASSHLFP